MNYIGLITTSMKSLTSLAGAGPVGLATMIIGGLGVLAGVAYLIARMNRASDDSAFDQGGADAGVTATTLKNQADRNREFQAAERARIEKEGPPKA